MHASEINASLVNDVVLPVGIVAGEMAPGSAAEILTDLNNLSVWMTKGGTTIVVTSANFKLGEMLFRDDETREYIHQHISTILKLYVRAILDEPDDSHYRVPDVENFIVHCQMRGYIAVPLIHTATFPFPIRSPYYEGSLLGAHVWHRDHLIM